MPAPLIPPPLTDTGAITYPRTLQKWLDVNPISRLTRTQGYITVPEFSVNVTNWNGASDIIASFNYEGPSNFSLSSINTEIPLQPNYLMCISWRDGNGNIFRYALWKGVGEVILFNLPLYTGQVIYQNFRIEIWSVNNQATVSQSSILTLYTSVLGKVDYRWGTDFVLVNPDAICTNFEVTSAQPLVTLPVTNPLENAYNITPMFNDWLRADTGVNTDTWTDKQFGTSILINNQLTQSTSQNLTVGTDSGISGQKTITGPMPLTNEVSITSSGTDIMMLIKYNGDGTLLSYLDADVPIVYIQNGYLYAQDLRITTGLLNTTKLGIGQWYIIEIAAVTTINNIPSGVIVNVWPIGANLQSQNYLNEFVLNVIPNQVAGLTFAATASVEIAEILIYSHVLNLTDQLTNLQYLQYRYQALLANPLVAPTGSYSAINQPVFTTLNKNNTPVPPSQVVFASSGGGVQGAG